MMDAYKVVEVLNEMLRESGFDLDNIDPKLAWEIFKTI